MHRVQASRPTGLFGSREERYEERALARFWPRITSRTRDPSARSTGVRITERIDAELRALDFFLRIVRCWVAGVRREQSF